MPEESEPRRASVRGIRPIVFGKNAPDEIFVDLNVEWESKLLDDTLIAESRIPVFHPKYGFDQFE